MNKNNSDVNKIMKKYGQKLDMAQGETPLPPEEDIFSRDYQTFRAEATSKTMNLYERACAFAANIVQVEPKKEEAEKIQEGIDWVGINVTPTSAYSLSILVMFAMIVLGVFVFLITMFLGKAQTFLALILLLAGIVVLKPLSHYPLYLAQRWRLSASNQMVMCILYIVMYMRHTSNLEHAIRFAGQHIGEPLNYDLRKIMWDVETQKYANLKQALDVYLSKWKDYNLSFVESFHLIESSLYESDHKRRLSLLDKGLEVILEGTFEKMMHFAQDIRSPITSLYFLGVILPILGLIMLPLVGSFLGAKWFHLALLYNVFLPLFVYFYGYSIMSKRPVGFSQKDIFEQNPMYKKHRYFVLGKPPNEKLIEPKKIAIGLIIILVLIGLFPLLYDFINPGQDITIDFPRRNFGLFLDYRVSETGQRVGPFGIGAGLFSLIIPFGLAFGISSYYKIRSSKLIKIRDETEKLEKEFQGALFQLGNRIGGGLPAEMAFSKVAETMKGTPSGTFFSYIDHNIRQLGMSLRNAIFDTKLGAINYYPSALIDSSMRVLVETANKGPQVVSTAMISISSYLDRVNKVNERLKDLLAEVISSMRAQISFLSPVISGIVVGIGTMITTIIGGLSVALAAAGGDPGDVTGVAGGMGDFLNMFPIESLIPPYFFQIVVGIYLVQIVLVLSILSNGIEKGIDKLNQENAIAKNLNKSIILYTVISFLTMVAFNFLATMIASRAAMGG